MRDGWQNYNKLSGWTLVWCSSYFLFLQNVALYADVNGKQFPVTRGQDVGRYQVRASNDRNSEILMDLHKWTNIKLKVNFHTSAWPWARCLLLPWCWLAVIVWEYLLQFIGSGKSGPFRYQNRRTMWNMPCPSSSLSVRKSGQAINMGEKVLCSLAWHVHFALTLLVKFSVYPFYTVYPKV